MIAATLTIGGLSVVIILKPSYHLNHFFIITLIMFILPPVTKQGCSSFRPTAWTHNSQPLRVRPHTEWPVWTCKLPKRNNITQLPNPPTLKQFKASIPKLASARGDLEGVVCFRCFIYPNQSKYQTLTPLLFDAFIYLLNH